MTPTNFLAVALFAAVFLSSFLIGENPALFINGLGLSIVISGTLGALFLSYGAQDMRASVRVAHNAYTVKPPSTDEIVNTLIYLSVRSHRKGVLALEDMEEETTVGFLKRALGMLVDGYKEEELRDVLLTEIHYFQQRRAQHERLFRYGARLAPAFGVAGSIAGLTAMLSGIGDPDVILRTIPIALTSTLYGIILSNFVLIPIAERINAKTQGEVMMHKLITDGVIAVSQEQNSLRLIKKLESFLTPAARHEDEQSFEELRERLHHMRLEE